MVRLKSQLTVHSWESYSWSHIERLTRSNLVCAIMAGWFDLGYEINTELDEMVYVDCPRCDLMLGH